MSEWTKGPWTFAPYSKKFFGLAPNMGTPFFMLQCRDAGHTKMPEMVANARLCSAAPALYEALALFMRDPRFQVAIGGNPHAIEAMMKQANAALAKAEGKESA